MRALLLATLMAAPAAAWADECKPVQGKWSSLPAVPCTSPVGMCTAGQLKGGLKGDYAFTMATIVSAGDPTIPSVFFYTGLSEIDTKKGSLVGTDAGTIDLNPLGSGKFTALISITDGTDKYDGAVGHLQIRGTLDFATGGASGDYRGEVCTPEKTALEEEEK